MICQSHFTSCSRVFSLFALLLLSGIAAQGQQTGARPDRGMMPNHSYAISDIENISLTNGNLNLSIPLASLPPIAGGELNFTIYAVYNSKLWNISRTEHQMGPLEGCQSYAVNAPQQSDLGGWRIGSAYSLTFRNAGDDFAYWHPQPDDACEPNIGERLALQNQWYRLIFTTPDGAEHELRPTDNYPYYAGTREYLWGYYKDTPDTIGGPMRYYSSDGSYLWAIVNPSNSATKWTVYMPDGTRIVQTNDGVQRLTDTNGNSIKVYSDPNFFHVEDEQTGREIKTSYDPNIGQGQGKVWYRTVGGDWASIDINWGSTLVQDKIYPADDWDEIHHTSCTRDNQFDALLPVVRSIVFPQTEPGVPAQQFTFSYNSDVYEPHTTSASFVCPIIPQTTISILHEAWVS